MQNPKISFIWDSSIDEVLGNKELKEEDLEDPAEDLESESMQLSHRVHELENQVIGVDYA